MIAAARPILLGPDEKPLVRDDAPRKDLAEVAVATRTRRRNIEATYDASRTTTEFQNHWANTDRLDADSANSRAVREVLVPRARYEVGNNGYADGIAQTYATDVVGVGPKLRMQTGSTGFNQMVEREFAAWAKAIQLRRKLWTMAHAKFVDGEAIGVLRYNPRVRHAVKLDLVLYETEQCQTPMLPFMDDGYIDGIQFDEFGNPTFYDILRRHPGGQHGWMFDQVPEKVPAAFVLHWFLMRRPGQHRGVPECTSTLNTGAAARRWREATLAAAETAADISLWLETGFQPDTIDAVAPMSQMEFTKRMAVAAPMGWKAQQMRAEHPNAQYAEFHKSLINEQARPKSMPFNKAACDSSSYNYASGRLDHQTYYAALDVDREDCDDTTLDPLFTQWFAEAVLAFGWSVRTSPAPAHSWDWPQHLAADIQAEANAADTRLKNGSLSIGRYYAEQGLDFEDVVLEMATSYGQPVEAVRRAIFTAIFNAQNQQASMQQAETQAEVASQPAAEPQEAMSNA